MPAGRPGLSWINLLLLLNASAIALQQQSQDGRPRPYRSSPPENPILHPLTIKHGAKHSASPRIEVSYNHFRDTHPSPASGYIANKNNNERAVATLAPTEPPAGGRDRRHSQHFIPARSAAGPTSGLSTGARSLQDFEVEKLVLLATIDGSIHARDRKTGVKDKWVFTPEDRRPVVQTIDHRINKSTSNEEYRSGKPSFSDDWMWFVEPSQDGAIFIFANDGKRGMQKLGLTVKELVESGGFDSLDPPFKYEAGLYHGLFRINAATGKLETGQAGSLPEDCRVPDAFRTEECASQSYLVLRRTDYTINISNATTDEKVFTINYSEWGANAKDRDLESQHVASLDDSVVYSLHDGTVVSIDRSRTGTFDDEDMVPRGQNKLPTPVVRVLDVVRNTDPKTSGPPLVVLPQPFAGISYPPEYIPDRVFINCTEYGAWYAMSEQQYPFVPSYAKPAQCYPVDLIDEAGAWPTADVLRSRNELIGLHRLSDLDPGYGTDIPSLPGPDLVIPKAEPYPYNSRQIDAGNITPPLDGVDDLTKLHAIRSVAYVLVAMLMTSLCIYASSDTFKKLPRLSKIPMRFADAEVLEKQTENVQGAIPQGEVVPDTAPHVPIAQKGVRFADDLDTTQDQSVVVVPSASAAEKEKAPATQQTDGSEETEQEPKEKKTHRGKRGGLRRNKQKNRRESEAKETLTEQLGRQIDTDHSMQPDEPSQMSGSTSDVSTIVRLNSLEIFKDYTLGYGSGGTIVYQGKFEGREVAVKQMMPQYYELVDQEVAMLRDSDDHPNVIRYYCTQKDVNFHYIALERCQASLFDLYKDGGSRDGLTDEQMQLVTQINSNIPSALQQLAAGLAHLHQLRIIHRDIKPQNILIAFPRKSQKTNFPRFVISDFGLCKTLPENMSTLMGTTGNAGTIGWKAPELISNPRMSDNGQSSQGNRQESTSSNDGTPTGVKRAIDIFSLGCVFFYVLTNGSHPFDADKNDIGTIIREVNIKRNVMNLAPLHIMGDEAEEPMHLIGWMLSPSPSDRPTAQVVLKHPFFWSDAARLAFLCDVSDHFEREPREPPSHDLLRLEQHAPNVIRSGDFLARLDRRFVETLGKQRKYHGGRMLDLLRALRNKKNHYADMPDDVKDKVGPLPGGYLRYWTRRFPQLIVACYEVLRECGLERDPRFREYMGFADD